MAVNVPLRQGLFGVSFIVHNEVSMNQRRVDIFADISALDGIGTC